MSSRQHSWQRNHSEEDVLRALVVMQPDSPHLQLAIVILESPVTSANNQDTAPTSARPSNRPRSMQRLIKDALEVTSMPIRPLKRQLHHLHPLHHLTRLTHPLTPPAAPTAPGNAQNTTQSAQSVTEFAGNASLRSFDSSDPLCLLRADRKDGQTGD